VLARLDGVGDVRIFGARELCDAHMARTLTRSPPTNLTAGEGLSALSSRRNVQVASGRAQPAADHESGRFPAQCRGPWGAAHRPTPSSAILIVQETIRTGRVNTHPRRGPRRTRSPGITAPMAISTSAKPCPLLIFPAVRARIALATADRIQAAMRETGSQLPRAASQ